MRPPTIEEVAEYCAERGNEIDPEHFWSHYETYGWRTKNGPIKSWKAAVITWEKNMRRWSGEKKTERSGGMEAWAQLRNAALTYPAASYDSVERFEAAKAALSPELRRKGDAIGWKSIAKSVNNGNEDIIRSNFLREWRG